ANSLLASVVIVLLASYAAADYNAAEYCQLVPVGTKLPSLTSCQTYYICQNNGQVSAANCIGTNIFDKDYQECVPASVGNCASGNPCAHKNKIWVSDSNTCGVWHYCVNGSVIGSGMCPNNEVFNDASQMCQYGQCSNTVMTDHGLPLVDNVCSIMQNEKFFGDFNNCHAWHRCNGMILQSGICEYGTTYDSSQRTCVYSNGNTCAGPVSVTCNAANNGKLTADNNICSVYYQCVSQNNQWSWQRNECPYGDYYDVNLKDCQSRQAATPIATCDRCEYATTTWVNAVDSNCTEYLTCNNGREIAIGYCSHQNSYFNEEKQMCVEGGNLSNYRTYNGACALPQSTPPSTSGNGTTPSGSGSSTSGSVTTTTGSVSTTTESGSSATGSGSSATGSGSTTTKSGTIATGSGSTATESGVTATTTSSGSTTKTKL
ncbi:hypothetical protein DOY81_007170, partial [Sarcophaga bullata]